MKTLLQLLKKQPKKIKKNQLFIEIVNIYNFSNELKKLKISNYCFNLLNKAKILPENLNFFYKRFNLPKNSFFPLFLKLKREYILSQKQSKKEKEKYIYEKMIKLPTETKNMIKMLNSYEKKINKLNKTPLWTKIIYPTSKRKANEYLRYSNIQWAILFNKFLDELSNKYNCKIDLTIKNKIDLFILEIYNEKYTYQVIIKQFRLLSKKYHPDKGGTSLYFNILKDTKERLCSKRILT
ncbi:MAG TPA: hypothetical protein PLE45_05520 [Spirochaetota bacterium]|nr:hypothetical protein [Spirochaetota bacterium]HPP05720.1 hypothetical protein [Spirochaetota bacterium]